MRRLTWNTISNPAAIEAIIVVTPRMIVPIFASWRIWQEKIDDEGEA